MTDKITIKLIGPEQRQRAQAAILRAPNDYVVTIAEPTRTLDQNAKLWPMLTDIRRARPDGRDHSEDVWKSLFLHALGQEMQLERALDGKGIVPMGHRSSQLSKRLFADLIELIYAYGAEHGVRWSEPLERAA